MEIIGSNGDNKYQIVGINRDDLSDLFGVLQTAKLPQKRNFYQVSKSIEAILNIK